MFRKNHRQYKKLHNQAYLAFDAGDLQTPADKFAELAKGHPDNAQYRYMLGLAAKYRMDWALSLQANLAAIACAPKFDEAAHWNAAIAATALHDWQTARQLWAACGIPLPEGEGEGEIETDFGIAVLRLNPWADGECVYARRIDPCRSRIINVPLPESGYRMGDIVLHDGASTGRRADGQGGEVLVFNALERWWQSPRQTYAAFVQCPSEADSHALSEQSLHTDTYAEDWTSSISFICLRCSYGTPHNHEHHASAEPGAWQAERSFGIAARSLADAQALLDDWAAQADGRAVWEIVPQDYPLPRHPESGIWRKNYDEDDE